MRIRVFKALTHQGMSDEFKAFFLGTALPLVRTYEGLVDVVVGLPDKTSPNQFMMLSIWRDQAALEAFAGADWQAPVLHVDEQHLVREAVVDHYDLLG